MQLLRKKLNGTKYRVCCENEKCRDLHKKDMRVRRQETTRRRYNRQKLLKTKKKFCDHCGAEFGCEDNYKYPVCHRKECQEWWEIERPKRKRHLMAKYRKEKRYSTRIKVEKPEPLPTDYDPKYDFSQEKYEQEQALMAKPNGWKCRRCGKPLTGNFRYHCSDCRIKIDRVFERMDGDYIYDDASGITGGYDWGVASV